MLIFGGYDKVGCKILQGRSLFNPVLSVDNTLLRTFQRFCSYFQDTGVLIWGGGGGACTFGALQPTAKWSFDKARSQSAVNKAHTHALAYAHRQSPAYKTHTLTLPAGAIVANLAPSAHALYALGILCLLANRRLPFKLLLSHPFPSLSTLGSYLIHSNPPFPLCPLLLCSMYSIY